MRILYHHRVASKDGQYVHIEEMVAALGRLSHEVVLVGPELPDEATFGGESGLVDRLKRRLPKAAYEVLELGYSLPAHRRLARAARRQRPDLIYERYNLHFAAGALHRRRNPDVPLFLEVNAPLAFERGRYGGLGWPGLARASEAWLFRAADRVFTVTEVLKGMIVAAGVPSERVVVTPNGIDPARFEAAPAPEEAKAALGLAGRRVVGFTGFMREWHKLETVVAWLADAAPSDVVLLLVGDGPARPGIEAEARARGVAERVTVTGVVPREAIPAHVAAFDTALQPAVVDYASPLKLFEYMALGRAIVAPDQPNIREILTDGQDALLVAEGGLTVALDRLLADDALLDRLGREAKRTLKRRNLTWDANAATVIAHARAALAERPAAGKDPA